MEFPPPTEGTFRVVTWNLWWRFGDEPERRHAAIRSVLAATGADVVGLQEVSGDDAAAVARAAGLACIESPGAERPGNALLSRWPAREHGSTPLPARDGTVGPRTARWAVLDATCGRLPVVVSHLNHRFDESATRLSQVRALSETAAGLRGDDPAKEPPVVLLADLNAVPDSDEIRALTGRAPAPVAGFVFNDCWPQVRDDPGHTWVRRNPYATDAMWPGRRIDYVAVSWPRAAPTGNPAQAFLLGDGPVDGVWPSDHLGLAVDLFL